MISILNDETKQRKGPVEHKEQNKIIQKRIEGAAIPGVKIIDSSYAQGIVGVVI